MTLFDEPKKEYDEKSKREITFLGIEDERVYAEMFKSVDEVDNRLNEMIKDCKPAEYKKEEK